MINTKINVNDKRILDMLKLYKLTENKKEYWETWDNGKGSHTIHWGVLGTKGSSKTIKASPSQSIEETIQKEIDNLINQGYVTIELENHYTLLIEYLIKGMGTKEDLEKRHKLEARMNETLGWTGLGACDGGSIGSNTMEVYNFVVDFKIAKKVIEKDLANTKFSNYSKIYNPNI